MDNFDFKTAKRTFSLIGIALILFFIATLAVQEALIFLIALLAPSLWGYLENPSVQLLFSSATMYLCGLPVFYLLVRKLPKSAPAKNKCTAKALRITFIISVSLSYFGSIVGDLLSAVINNVAGSEVDSGSIELISSVNWYDALIFAVIIGPLVEEFIFRKVIIDRTRAYGEKLALIFSSLIFAFFHMSIQQFFYAFLIGLLLGYLYLRKGRLIYTWLIHAAFNLFGTVIPLLLIEFADYESILSSMGDPEKMYEIIEKNPIQLWLIFAYSLSLLVFAFWGCGLLGKKIKTVHFKDTENKLPKDTEAQTAFVNFGVIAFILFSAAYPFAMAYLEKTLK